VKLVNWKKGDLMGLIDGFRKKEGQEKEEVVEEIPEGKYPDQECSFCGKLNADKKWMGQYFHKKCLRKLKKGAKKML